MEVCALRTSDRNFAEVLPSFGSQLAGDPLLMPDDAQKPENKGKQLSDLESSHGFLLWLPLVSSSRGSISWQHLMAASHGSILWLPHGRILSDLN